MNAGGNNCLSFHIITIILMVFSQVKNNRYYLYSMFPVIKTKKLLIQEIFEWIQIPKQLWWLKHSFWKSQISSKNYANYTNFQHCCSKLGVRYYILINLIDWLSVVVCSAAKILLCKRRHQCWLRIAKFW